MSRLIDTGSWKGWIQRLQGDDRLVAIIDAGGLYAVPEYLYRPGQDKARIDTAVLVDELNTELGDYELAISKELGQALQKIRRWHLREEAKQ